MKTPPRMTMPSRHEEMANVISRFVEEANDMAAWMNAQHNEPEYLSAPTRYVERLDPMLESALLACGYDPERCRDALNESILRRQRDAFLGHPAEIIVESNGRVKPTTS